MKKLKLSTLKKILFNSIETIENNKGAHLVNPEKDFSRKQKISFRDTMLFPIVASNHTTAKEMAEFFPESQLPSQAALSYRRDQIKPTAFRELLYTFNSKLPQPKTFHGMLQIACDGVRTNTPYNPKDKDSYVACIENRKGFNQYHVVTCFDVLNDIYTDAVIQSYYSMNEKEAFCTMVDRYPKDKPVLFIADRGFASYNVIAHIINSGHHFVMRLTTPMAKVFFESVPEYDANNTFDIEDTIHIGRTRSKSATSLCNYHSLGNCKTYDFIPKKSTNIDCFHVRLVKFTLPSGDSEYILTDLPSTVLTLSEIQEVYRSRWGIETSYRFLKYSNDMVNIHSLKPEFIFQEIFAKLICYNFCASVYKLVSVSTKKATKHEYTIEKTYLIQNTMEFLKGKIKNLINLVQKRKVPVRAGRSFTRNIRRQHADTLQYR